MKVFFYIFSFLIFTFLFFCNSQVVHTAGELDVIDPDNVEIIYNDIKSSEPHPCAGPSCEKMCVCSVADPATNFLGKKEVTILHNDESNITPFWRVRETTGRNKIYTAYSVVNFNIGQDKCFFRIDKEIEPAWPLSGEMFQNFANGFVIKCTPGTDPGCLNVKGVWVEEINMGSCKIVVKKKVSQCCCQLVEGGEITNKYSCKMAEGYEGDQYLCEKVADKDLAAAVVYPVPAAGDCSALETASADYKPAPQTFSGISFEKLKQDAAAKLNPKEFTDPTNFLGRMIAGMMANVGAIAIALYIWAGFTWMTAQGNQEKLTKAKQILLWTSLGLVVMLSSYILVSFIFKDVLGLR